MNSSTNADVVIVGAGPTGMTAAIALTQQGLKVRIVDRAAQHKQHSQAGVLWPRTQEVYATLGVIAPWQQRARTLSRVSFYGYGKYLGDMPANHNNSAYRQPLLIGQNETEQILEQLCLDIGAPVERCVEAVAFEESRDAVQVRLKHSGPNGHMEESVEAAWLLATDGAGSAVRQWAGLSWNPHRFQGQKVFQVDAITRWELPLNDGHAYFFLHNDGYFGCVPLPDGYHRFFISEPDSGATNVNDPKLADMEKRLAQMSGFAIHLSEPRWLSGKHYQNVITDTFRKGRVLFGGDAGKAVVPLNGQGMNTGIQDMFNLCWKLAFVQKGFASASLLDTYNAERHYNAAHLVSITGEYFVHATQPTRLQEVAVRNMGKLAISSDWVAKRYQSFASMLDISYRDAPGALIAEAEGNHRDLHTGDRAPDAWVVDSQTLQTIRLHDKVFSYSRFTLLLLSAGEEAGRFEDFCHRYRAAIADRSDLIACFPVVERQNQVNAASNGGIGVLLDYQQTLHACYGARAITAILVRPDQHVAFIGGMEYAAALESFVKQVLHQVRP